MDPIRDIIPRLPSKMEITKRQLRKLEMIEGVRRDRERGSQDLAFNARPFVLCGLPLRQPPKEQICYTRTNGKFFLEITPHPKLGMPYGQDRLVMPQFRSRRGRERTHECFCLAESANGWRCLESPIAHSPA
jgi:hypothetical protein